MSTPTISRFVLLVIAVAALGTAGCASTGTLTPYYARAYYGPGPWDRYYFRPPYPGVVGPTVLPDGPVAVPLPEPPPEAVSLPEPPLDIPDMGMPHLGPGDLDLAGPGF